MTNEIIRRRAKLIGPSDSTKNLIVEKNANQLDSIQKSGLTNLNQTIKELSSGQIPNVVEGVVIGYVNEDKKVKYKLIADNPNLDDKNGEIEGYCVIVRTPLDIGTKTDPERLLAALTDSKTEEEKIELRTQILAAILEHDVVAAASEDEKLPKLGEHVTVRYYNSLVDSGEPIKGLYELIKKNNSYYEEPKELLDFYNSPLNQSDKTQNILPDSEDDVPGVVDYAKSIVADLIGIFSEERQRSTQVTLLNQGDSRWSTLSLGSVGTIGGVGCCLTSYTMAHNYLINPDKELTPDVAADIGRKMGGFTTTGLVVHEKLAKTLSMSFRGFSPDNSVRGLRNFIESALNSGDALVFHVDWKNDPDGDHWMMCYKKDSNGNYFCNDPAGGKIIIIDKETLTGKFKKREKILEYRIRRAARMGRV